MIVVIDMSVALIHFVNIAISPYEKKRKRKKIACGCAKLFFAGRESGTNCVGGSPEAKETNGSFFSLGLIIIVNLKTKSLDNTVQEFLLA